MRIIKRQQDLVILRRVGALPAALLDQVEDYFNQLSVELEGEAESPFCLGENGYIVLLEAGDNVHDLGNVSTVFRSICSRSAIALDPSPMLCIFLIVSI